MVRGFAALMRGLWQLARTTLEEAEGIFRHHCKGVTWERDTIHNFLLRSLVQMGEIRELKARWSVFFRESQERGDRYAATMLSSFYMTLIRLAGNLQPETETELETALEQSASGSFSLRHSNAFEALIHLYLYRSDVSRALVRFESVWPRYERSMLLRIRMTRIDLLEMRARCSLAMAEKPGDPGVHLRQAADLMRPGSKRKGTRGPAPMRFTSAQASPPARKTRSARSNICSKPRRPMTMPRCRCERSYCGIASVKFIRARIRAPSTTGPSSGSRARESSRRRVGRACTLPASPRSPVTRSKRPTEE